MSCVCVLTPVVVASWPVLSSAVVSAATAMGYQVAVDSHGRAKGKAKPSHKVELELPRSEIVTSQLDRDRSMKVVKDGVEVVFSRDARGQGSLCVSGAGHTDEELRQMGEELSRAVVQSYVHQRLKEEMSARDFVVVEEEVDEDQSIRLKVRHWEN